MAYFEEKYYPRTAYNRLPLGPGIYIFYNTKNVPIYIGKAIDLRKRVASYFTKKAGHPLKTQKMIAQIHKIRIVLMPNGYDALMLENNFIKKYQPRYNILLKDGKTYPYFCITNEPFPRLIVTRQRYPSLGKYFGPFTSMTTMDQIEALIRGLYPLRTCKYHLSQKNIEKGKFKVCLEYHIGNCLGPCVALQMEAAYAANIKEVIHLLKGNFQQVKKSLQTKMKAAAKERNFKQAQAYKEKLAAIARYQSRSLVAHPTLGDCDVIAIVGKEAHAFVSYLHIKKGMIVFAQTVEVQKRLEEEEETILAMGLAHFREKANSKARQVLSNRAIETLPTDAVGLVPKMGDKHKLVNLAVKNALFFQKELLNSKVKRLQGGNSTLQMLQKELQLKALPRHIECFDNANLQGTNPVAGMVCFKNGQPAKRDYRHFHIKSVVGPDDFASMAEVITRRYTHLVATKAPLPNLILIDGGKGQLSATMKVLKAVGVADRVEVIAIAKKLELLYAPDNPYPLYLSKRSPALKLLQRIRNAAHLFSTTFHKNIRLKQGLSSVLTAIPTIGPQTSAKLLKAFGSVENIKKADKEALIAQVGEKKAARLQEHLHS